MAEACTKHQMTGLHALIHLQPGPLTKLFHVAGEAAQEPRRGLVAGKGDVALQRAHRLAPGQQVQQGRLAGARGTAQSGQVVVVVWGSVGRGCHCAFLSQ